MTIIIGHKSGPLGNVPVTIHQDGDAFTPNRVTDVRANAGPLLGWAFKSTETGEWVARTFVGFDCESSTHDTQMEALRAAGGIA